jgi:catechol 2,3-dioxygenase-like lactoylglutathione lyase family enzyme
MKRLHVHIAVGNLAESIRFYSALFGSEPNVSKPDYAKWMLDDPRVNFAVSQRGAPAGLNHLGVQVETEDELAEMHTRLQSVQADIVEQKGTACCYASSDKYWATDPQGTPWETFHTLDSVPVFGGEAEGDSACCVPTVITEKNDGSRCCDPEDSKTGTQGGCC